MLWTCGCRLSWLSGGVGMVMWCGAGDFLRCWEGRGGEGRGGEGGWFGGGELCLGM